MSKPVKVVKKTAKTKTVKAIKAKPAKVVNFKSKVLSKLNKDEKELQAEAISDKIEDFIIETESNIGSLEGDIKKGEQDLKRAKRELAKGKKSASEVIYEIADKTYSGYIDSLNRVEESAHYLTANVNECQTKLYGLHSQKDRFEMILKELKS